MLATIHPPNGDPNKCCFRGPSFNSDKDMREKLHQYNLKHPGDKGQNSTTQDRSRIPPKQADLPKGKVNFASPTGLDTSSITEENVELIEKYEEPIYVEDFLYDNPPEEYDNMFTTAKNMHNSMHNSGSYDGIMTLSHILLSQRISMELCMEL